MISAGRLRTRITFLIPTGSVDETGDFVFVDGGSVWAEFDVKPPSGAPYRTDTLEQAQQTRWIRIRPANVSVKWRVRCGEQLFEIVSPPIDVGMRHQEMLVELRVI